MREYVGAIHIHSVFSDGLRSIPEIASIAADSGLDYLLFADHMTLEPLNQGLEKWYDSVLAVIGYEINDPDNINHYLAFGLDEVLPADLTANEYVRLVKARGGVGFIAHPDEKRTLMPELPPYPWKAWDAEGFDGIEIWNHSSEWLERLSRFNKYFYVMHPLKYLRGPEPETLARWDELNSDRCVAGIGGLDAHAYPYRLGPLTIYIFRYKVLFKGIRTHILLEDELTGDVSNDKWRVLGALKSGSCFISNFRWGDARGFRFYANSNGTIHGMGSTVAAPSMELSVQCPEKAAISLRRNGEKICKKKGRALSLTVDEPGAYRVSVTRKGKSWIYSNHIRLRG